MYDDDDDVENFSDEEFEDAGPSPLISADELRRRGRKRLRACSVPDVVPNPAFSCGCAKAADPSNAGVQNYAFVRSTTTTTTTTAFVIGGSAAATAIGGSSRNGADLGGPAAATPTTRVGVGSVFCGSKTAAAKAVSNVDERTRLAADPKSSSHAWGVANVVPQQRPGGLPVGPPAATSGFGFVALPASSSTASPDRALMSPPSSAFGFGDGDGAETSSSFGHVPNPSVACGGAGVEQTSFPFGRGLKRTLDAVSPDSSSVFVGHAQNASFAYGGAGLEWSSFPFGRGLKRPLEDESMDIAMDAVSDAPATSSVIPFSFEIGPRSGVASDFSFGKLTAADGFGTAPASTQSGVRSSPPPGRSSFGTPSAATFGAADQRSNVVSSLSVTSAASATFTLNTATTAFGFGFGSGSANRGAEASTCSYAARSEHMAVSPGRASFASAERYAHASLSSSLPFGGGGGQAAFPFGGRGNSPLPFGRAASLAAEGPVLPDWPDVANRVALAGLQFGNAFGALAPSSRTPFLFGQIDRAVPNSFFGTGTTPAIATNHPAAVPALPPSGSKSGDNSGLSFGCRPLVDAPPSSGDKDDDDVLDHGVKRKRE